MTLPSGSNKPPISLSDINTEFALGRNIAPYKNARWYKDDNSRGFFAATGPISFSDFYAKRKTSPVVPNPGVTLTTSQNYTIPMFNSLTVTAVSGTGGTGGTDGDCAIGGDGGAGNPSSLADYVATGSGPGGTRSGNAGSSNTASTTITITDANQASVLARYGVSKAATIGGGGGGGGTGLYTNYYFQCDLLGFLYGVPYCQIGHNYGSCNGHAGGGAAGADGYIVIAWT